ncbi:Alpha/Beta hydrolase protein [Mycena epipterygia]|nr:Alpha/Beta hydrolase protein [Mycena epipterygia]
MRLPFVLISVVYGSLCYAISVFADTTSTPVVVNTTSGLLQGSKADGLLTFEGIRFAQPATGALRWEPPVAFFSTAPQNATRLGSACVQQFPFGDSLDPFLFNNPTDPPAEDEDSQLITSNVWAPASATTKLPVVIWIYGGSLAFGTASIPLYDGASLAANQGIIVVSFNYRTNVFGFPGSPDLPLAGNNLELAFQWVQQNIAQFGGDPTQVTIMGQSAGSKSVAVSISRHTPSDAPFRAAIMLSGTQQSTSPTPSFASFNTFSTAVGCTQAPGPARLACLKQVPASVIRSFTNGPTGTASFQPVVDNVSMFADPLQRIRTGLTAKVPFIIGNTQNDGSLFSVGLTDLSAYLTSTFDGLVTADQVRPLYPGLNDSLIISEVIKDFLFLCLPSDSPAELWSGAAVGAGISSIYRYEYGPVFADLQFFPGAGAWHTSELPEIFGTFNRSTATAPEVTLSQTMQTLVANFVKDPTVSPAPNWPQYVPGNSTTTLAKLAYNGNFLASNVVQTAESDSIVRCSHFSW